MFFVPALIAAFASSTAAIATSVVISEKINENKIPVVYHEKKKGADYKRRALKWFTHQQLLDRYLLQ